MEFSKIGLIFILLFLMSKIITSCDQHYFNKDLYIDGKRISHEQYMEIHGDKSELKPSIFDRTKASDKKDEKKIYCAELDSDSAEYQLYCR